MTDLIPVETSLDNLGWFIMIASMITGSILVVVCGMAGCFYLEWRGLALAGLGLALILFGWTVNCLLRTAAEIVRLLRKIERRK